MFCETVIRIKCNGITGNGVKNMFGHVGGLSLLSCIGLVTMCPVSFGGQHGVVGHLYFGLFEKFSIFGPFPILPSRPVTPVCYVGDIITASLSVSCVKDTLGIFKFVTCQFRIIVGSQAETVYLSGAVIVITPEFVNLKFRQSHVAVSRGIMLAAAVGHYGKAEVFEVF